MSEFKGTKGKWYRYTNSRITSAVCSENEERLIHMSGKNDLEAKANSQLISKSPELLDLLQRMYDVYSMKETISGSLRDFMIEANELIKEATNV